MKTRSTFVLLISLFGCKPAQETGAVAPPPAPVEMRQLEMRTIESANEYLATLVSRRAVTLFPQVSGYVRSIDVKPGTQVKKGTVLLQVDANSEQASLRNLVATRESLEASAGFARQRLERSKALRGDGIVSQQDADQAQVQADQAEASLRATDALIASQKAKLGFFQIVAPFDGVVGNVPVKLGDFVTPASELTSVTQDAGLEAEVWVPVERASQLTPRSRIRLIDGSGQTLGESPIVFTAARADPSSQLVLVKAAFEAMPNLRADQLTRARVIWETYEGILVPSLSVVRQAGLTFVFVAENGREGLEARRRPVRLGGLQGSDAVVLEGVSSGQQLITSGLQQLAEGARVSAAGETSR